MRKKTMDLLESEISEMEFQIGEIDHEMDIFTDKIHNLQEDLTFYAIQRGKREKQLIRLQKLKSQGKKLELWF